MAPVGKRIRDAERALRRCTPEKEAALREHLASLHEEKLRSEKRLKEKANSQKYHLVKFVERQKLCRKIYALEKKLLADSLGKSERDELTKKKSLLEDDLTYVLYYPMSMKYIGTPSQAWMYATILNNVSILLHTYK